jgi:hypothetical protein
VLRRILTRRLALTAVLTALLAGGTAVALGASGTTSSPSQRHARHARAHAHHGSSGLLATAAGYLHISPKQLRAELRSGKTLAQIAAATPGSSEAGLIAALVAAAKQKLQTQSAQVQARITALVQGGPGAAGHAVHSGLRHGGALRAAAVSYLGLTREELRAQLHAGKTLAQIADATPGRSSSGLAAALIAAGEKKLQAAGSAKMLTASAKAKRLAALRTHVAELLNRVHGSGPTGH